MKRIEILPPSLRIDVNKTYDNTQPNIEHSVPPENRGSAYSEQSDPNAPRVLATINNLPNDFQPVEYFQNSIFAKNEYDGEDATRIVEYSNDASPQNTTTYLLTIRLRNPLSVPLTKVNLRIYGVGVVGDRVDKQMDDVPPDGIVFWYVNVTLVKPQYKEIASDVDKEQSFNSSDNTTVPIIAPKNDSGYGSERTGFREAIRRKNNTAIFIVVSSDQISRIDGQLVLGI